MITRAKQFINDNCREDISLADVAKACNTSTFYFCKLFKRHAGLNFTRHLSNVRIEKAKNLLLNRELRVSEIGYEVGFQSLTHFNRVFKKVVGQSPTDTGSGCPLKTRLNRFLSGVASRAPQESMHIFSSSNATRYFTAANSVRHCSALASGRN